MLSSHNYGVPHIYPPYVAWDRLPPRICQRYLLQTFLATPRKAAQVAQQAGCTVDDDGLRTDRAAIQPRARKSNASKPERNFKVALCQLPCGTKFSPLCTNRLSANAAVSAVDSAVCAVSSRSGLVLKFFDDGQRDHLGPRDNI